MIRLIDLDLHQDLDHINLVLRFSDDPLTSGEVVLPHELAIDIIDSIAKAARVEVHVGSLPED